MPTQISMRAYESVPTCQGLHSHMQIHMRTGALIHYIKIRAHVRCNTYYTHGRAPIHESLHATKQEHILSVIALYQGALCDVWDVVSRILS